MSRDALGLIETKGLIAAIEATDAAAKASAVVIATVELTDAAFLTVKIEGELGAVQAAVKAGTEAAERVGEIVAVDVIPRPDEGLVTILPPIRYVSKYHPDEDRPPLGLETPIDSMGTKKPAPDDFGHMTVAELRRYARQLKRIDLRGRQISKANKQQLIDAIKRVLDMD